MSPPLPSNQCSSPSPSIPPRRQPLQLLHILLQAKWREVADLDPLRAHKHAAVLRAGEVAGSLDRAIVLARGLVEHDADPRAGGAGDAGHGADEGDRAAAGIGRRGKQSAARVQRQACYRLFLFLFFVLFQARGVRH